jgi:DNA-binding transcriptional ArsR family regulator
MPKASTTVVEPEVCCPSIADAPLDENAAKELARTFSALADPVRLRLYSLIAEAGEICSCDMLQPLRKAQPTISHRRREARPLGLVAHRSREARGRAGRALSLSEARHDARCPDAFARPSRSLRQNEAPKSPRTPVR